MNTPASVQKYLDKTGVNVYVYTKERNGSLIYLYYSSSSRAFIRDFGVGKSYLSNLYSRSEGWYKNTILFSKVNLLPGVLPTITIDELKTHYELVKMSVPRPDNRQLVAIHKITGVERHFGNK